jgi:hypothetical protein
MAIALAIGLAVAVGVAAAVLAEARTAVLVAALGWLFLDLPYAFLVLLSATPCAFSGSGVLTPTTECPVQAIHVLSVVLGGCSVASVFVGCVGGFVYAQTGPAGGRRVFRIGLFTASGLFVALLAAVADLILPRQAPSD